MIDVHVTEVDGVRCFWVDSGRPTLAARLVFRHGMVDEPLRRSGWTHLLEHLALHDAPRGSLETNGSVDLLTTSFDAHGPAGSVSRHLEEVTTFLASPRLDGIARERRVLAAERAMRGGPVGRALAERSGARGPGVVQYGEMGLNRATAEGLADLAAAVFTRDNAALVLDGPPPTDLRLTLHGGAKTQPPSAGPGLHVAPTMYVDDSGLVLSGVVERNAAATILPDILHRLLFEELRRDGAGAYNPWATYEVIDVEQAVVVAGSDVADHLLQSLADRTLQVVRRASGSLPMDLVEDTVKSRLQSLLDPYTGFSHASRAARRHLLGSSPQTSQQWVDEIRGVDAVAVARSATQLADSLLLGLPGDSTWRDQLPRSTPNEPIRTHEGLSRPRRHRNWPAQREVLRTGPEGLVQIIHRGTGTTRSASASTAELVASDELGNRHIIDAEGWTLTVDPRQWRGGDAIVAAVDAATPADHAVALADVGGEPWRPASWWQRLWYAVPDTARPLVGPIVFYVVLMTVAVATGRVLSAVAWTVIAAAVWAAAWAVRGPSRHD